MATEAQFPGECDECGGPIRPGDPVIHSPRGWVHADCPDAMPEPRAIHVCPHCNLAQPCDCEAP